jgi:acetyl-CoA C-acetyltransferase
MPRLGKIGWTLSDADLIELTSALAPAGACRRICAGRPGLGLEQGQRQRRGDRPGSPAGRERARLLTTLIHSLNDRSLKRGIASLCLGGGEAVAMAVEMEG